MATNAFRIGQSVPRLEDDALLRGQGRFVDDVDMDGQAYAVFLRSPYAHADIAEINIDDARAADGVIAIFTGADLAAEEVGIINPALPLKNQDGSAIYCPPWRAMTTDRARYVGDTVAVVIAETVAQATDAAELIEVDYAERPAHAELATAADRDVPEIWRRSDLPNNTALDWAMGDKAATDSAFAGAAHVTRLDLVNNRIMVHAVEPRGAVVKYENGRYEMVTCTQGSTQIQAELAKSLKVDIESVRVVTPDVGGGFGIKNGIYPEQIVLAWVAQKIGRPVKWTPDRTDAFISDYHARDHLMHAELALDADGTFLALRCQTTSNMGAYATGAAPVIPTAGGSRMLTNVYKIPHLHATTQCVFTNTTPIAAFRGAGKPEFGYVVERLVDAAARETGIDPAQLRRRNFVQPQDMPYETAAGLRYDSGDFSASMDQALKLADQEGFAARRDAAAADGKLRGFGFCVYTEPDGFRDNNVRLTFDASGVLTVDLTGQTNGQGHVTIFSQIAATELGLPPENVTVHQGDTDRIAGGSGTGGSRTTTVAGAAIHYAGKEVVEKGRRIAAHLMQADADDIEFSDGMFTVTGTERSVSLVDIAKASFNTDALPDDLDPGLTATYHFDAKYYSYPSGCHVCEVEIDRDTGVTDIVNYVLVSDFGTIVNPMLLEGQLHGGIVQGIGQALMEEAVYDDGGQLTTGNFTDYWVPRAREIPDFTWGLNTTRCETNPLGVKGCGESGPTAALPAVMNAVIDALAPAGVTHIDMPATPEKIWRALQSSS